MIPLPIVITVLGTPRPQGSKRPVRNQKTCQTMMVESSRHLPTWRSDVRDAAAAAMGDALPLHGALSVDFLFVTPEPKSKPKDRTHPTVPPDGSKLQRAVEDALEGIVFGNDAEITQWRGRKRYGTRAYCRITVDLDDDSAPADELLAFDWSVS